MANKSGLLLFQGKKKRTQEEKEADVIDKGIDKFEKYAKKTMKVKIDPSKEGDLSKFAKDHVTKTNKKGKVTIKVSKADMWEERSKLFETDYETVERKGKTYYKSLNPNAQSTAKGFKKARRRDRLTKAGAGILGGVMAGSQRVGGIKDLIRCIR